MKVDYIQHCGTDLTVVNAARVSMDKESEELVTEDKKLIKYLHKHKHLSPFNHTFLTFRVKAPIFVARQLVKHKFMPWNEVSRRYVDSDPEFYKPEGWRLKSDNVKQGSSDTIWSPETNPTSNYSPKVDQGYVHMLALNVYTSLLSEGVCPDQARMVLPQSMYTEWYWSGTLGAFLDMLVLRLDSHSQKETREVAQMIATHVKKLFPVCYEAVIGE